MAVRTKQAIRQAFIELLNERPLDKISVKDIAERSTVNRNTFYYYYADIYALVEEIFQTETQLFMEKLHSYASWEEAFREATAFVSENKRAVHHLFNSGNRNILEHYYHKVTYAAMLSYVRGQAEDLSAAEEDIQALAQFYAAALSGMTADWLRGGMKSNVNDHIDRLGRLQHPAGARAQLPLIRKKGDRPRRGRSSLCLTVRLRERAGRIWRRSAETRCGRRAYRCAPREAFRAD